MPMEPSQIRFRPCHEGWKRKEIDWSSWVANSIDCYELSNFNLIQNLWYINKWFTFNLTLNHISGVWKRTHPPTPHKYKHPDTHIWSIQIFVMSEDVRHSVNPQSVGGNRCWRSKLLTYAIFFLCILISRRRFIKNIYK